LGTVTRGRSGQEGWQLALVAFTLREKKEEPVTNKRTPPLAK
jgi:hypothetical protein